MIYEWDLKGGAILSARPSEALGRDIVDYNEGENLFYAFDITDGKAGAKTVYLYKRGMLIRTE